MAILHQFGYFNRPFSKDCLNCSLHYLHQMPFVLECWQYILQFSVIRLSPGIVISLQHLLLWTHVAPQFPHSYQSRWSQRKGTLLKAFSLSSDQDLIIQLLLCKSLCFISNKKCKFNKTPKSNDGVAESILVIMCFVNYSTCSVQHKCYVLFWK